MLTTPLPDHLDLLALHQRNPQRYPCLLQSAARGNARARYDVLLAFPQGGLRLDADGVTRDLSGACIDGTFLAALDARFAHERTQRDADDGLPFHGGWAVYLGYELAAQLEPRLRLPQAPGALPVAVALRCPVAVVRDHARGCVTVVAEPDHAACAERVRADVDALGDTLPVRIDIDAPHEDAPEAFLRGVAAIHDYLVAGDVFQVNLSRGWQARVGADTTAAALYGALRTANPAPFAGLFAWDDWAVISSSPERLLSVRDRVIETRPIAGTRARIAGDADADRIRELVGHPKERAEHIMLIDLERNDLGRVCAPGSVVVDELMTVESYAHVHHIVSNVRGVLRGDVTPGQAIAAVFPGGTITGCPKVRCMEIIAELEATGRGPYTGAIGYLDRNGDMDLNILIRTLWLQDGIVRWRAGAGIVADSDAAAELAETRAKARGLLRALGLRD
ncbi:aminodeoxychorismate synthase component I [Chiayiivirga flava]|uniref:Anthranilate synthase component 1 n=1 Tax=Chiayiivirga flava TaxID=659595 RepID=A0A7W8D884_9GAMM|nr:aminodeoxychorismate synthase component I [Chiayiivirga flava]MBB5209427.1 anthranilate synthase component 1 [Chiayiivirga flava]